MENIISLGENLFALESALGYGNIISVEYERSSAYELTRENPPFYNTIEEALNSIRRFNSFYISYAQIMHGIASNTMNTESLIASYNTSLRGVAETIEISNDIVDNSIIASGLVFNFAFERITYDKQIEALQEVLKTSSPIVLEMLNIYIDVIDDLEFTISDYYQRYMLSLENLALMTTSTLTKESLNQRKILLSENHKDSIDRLLAIKTSFEQLIVIEQQLAQKITEEDLGEESLRDFVIRNYEIYEEIN